MRLEMHLYLISKSAYIKTNGIRLNVKTRFPQYETCKTFFRSETLCNDVRNKSGRCRSC